MKAPTMADDFNANKDINRYLSQQGRAPQSHFDWETWRKIGQPGTYQAPPGSGSQFRGVSSGAGGPNYGAGGSNYNMFENTGNAIASSLAGPTSWMQNKFAKMGEGKNSSNSGSKASSGNDTDMADNDSTGNVTSGGSPGTSNRSQSASITSPATSRGMRRSRGSDFSGTLAQHNITMVQGNDNYGTIGGNMGGANVGSGNYDSSFQSKNTGGNQTSISNPPSGPSPSPTSGTPASPVPPTTGSPTPPTGNVPTGPTTGRIPPMPPPTRMTTTPNGPAIPAGPQRPTLPIGQGPSNYGNTPNVVGPQAPVQGPMQGPPRPTSSTGPSTLSQGPVRGPVRSSTQNSGLMGHANDAGGGQEAETARGKLTEQGINGPWRSETATKPVGPQAAAPGQLGGVDTGTMQGPASPFGSQTNTGMGGDSKRSPRIIPGSNLNQGPAQRPTDWGAKPTPGPYTEQNYRPEGKAPVAGPKSVASKKPINAEGGVGARQYKPSKPKAAAKAAPTAGPTSVASKKKGAK